MPRRCNPRKKPLFEITRADVVRTMAWGIEHSALPLPTEREYASRLGAMATAWISTSEEWRKAAEKWSYWALMRDAIREAQVYGGVRIAKPVVDYYNAGGRGRR